MIKQAQQVPIMVSCNVTIVIRPAIRVVFDVQNIDTLSPAKQSKIQLNFKLRHFESQSQHLNSQQNRNPLK